MNVFYAVVKLYSDLVEYFVLHEDTLMQIFFRERAEVNHVLVLFDCLTSISSKLKGLKHALKFAYEDFEKASLDHYYQLVLKNKNVRSPHPLIRRCSWKKSTAASTASTSGAGLPLAPAIRPPGAPSQPRNPRPSKTPAVGATAV